MFRSLFFWAVGRWRGDALVALAFDYVRSGYKGRKLSVKGGGMVVTRGKYVNPVNLRGHTSPSCILERVISVPPRVVAPMAPIPCPKKNGNVCALGHGLRVSCQRFINE